MKHSYPKHTYALRLAASLAVLAFGVAPIEAKETVAGISPFGTPTQKMSEIRAIGLHLAETTNPGETSYVVNAFGNSEIARFVVPDDAERYDNPRSKMQVNRDFFRATKEFADNAIEPSDTSSGKHFAGQIDLPAFLRNVGANYPTQKARDLLLYSVSPLTHYQRDPDLSMLDGVLPDHDHLAASRANSPYGAKEQADKLVNYTIHWGLLDMEWAVSDRHQHFMEEYTSLSASLRGATLATFAPDADTALRNAKANIDTALGEHKLEADGTLEMIHFRPQVVEEVHDQSQANRSIPIYERELSTRVPEKQEVSAAMNVEIAIRWTCQCDFDLAVKPNGGSIISYREPRTSKGRLFKDFTSSQDLNNGWETVTLSGSNGTVDLQQLLIAINLYSGAVRNQTVELRIAIDGETWGKEFIIQGQGNGGAGFEDTLQSGRPTNNAWIAPDIMEVLGGAS